MRGTLAFLSAAALMIIPAGSTTAADRGADAPRPEINIPSENPSAASRGFRSRTAGDLDAAIEAFTEAIALEPEDVELRFYRAMSYYDKQDYDRAITDFTEVIRLAPTWASGYIKRGYAYLGKKDFERALADFNETIRLQPDFAPLYNNRGNAYEAMGDQARADADFAEAKRLEREMDKRSR